MQGLKQGRACVIIVIGTINMRAAKRVNFRYATTNLRGIIAWGISPHDSQPRHRSRVRSRPP